jgi:Sec-independent protein secretion pathway component TatC
VITLTVMMLVPLILLYEFSIFLSAAIVRRRRTDEADASGLEPTIGAPENTVEAR